MHVVLALKDRMIHAKCLWKTSVNVCKRVSSARPFSTIGEYVQQRGGVIKKACIGAGGSVVAWKALVPEEFKKDVQFRIQSSDMGRYGLEKHLDRETRDGNGLYGYIPLTEGKVVRVFVPSENITDIHRIIIEKDITSLHAMRVILDPYNDEGTSMVDGCTLVHGQRVSADKPITVFLNAQDAKKHGVDHALATIERLDHGLYKKLTTNNVTNTTVEKSAPTPAPVPVPAEQRYPEINHTPKQETSDGKLIFYSSVCIGLFWVLANAK